mgnify:CR=1 FL=1
MPRTDVDKVKASYKGLLKKNKVITSPTYKLIRADFRRWLKNTAIFFAPAFLIFLQQLQSGATIAQASIALKVWALSTLMDLTRKFLVENTYKPVNEAGEVTDK